MAEMYGARPVIRGEPEAEQRGGDEAALFWCGCSYRFKDKHDAGASTPGGSAGPRARLGSGDSDGGPMEQLSPAAAALMSIDASDGGGGASEDEEEAGQITEDS